MKMHLSDNIYMIIDENQEFHELIWAWNLFGWNERNFRICSMNKSFFRLGKFYHVHTPLDLELHDTSEQDYRCHACKII